MTVEVETPSAVTGPVPVIEEFAASAGPAVNMTVPSAFVIGVAIVRVFNSAFVELSEHEETPVASETEHPP